MRRVILVRSSQLLHKPRSLLLRQTETGAVGMGDDPTTIWLGIRLLRG